MQAAGRKVNVPVREFDLPRSFTQCEEFETFKTDCISFETGLPPGGEPSAILKADSDVGSTWSKAFGFSIPKENYFENVNIHLMENTCSMLLNDS